MPDFNLITITKQPDPTSKIIELDIINDGIKDGDILRNVELIVDGTELKGIAFKTSGDPLEFGDNSRSIILTMRTPDDVPSCIVRHLAAGVDAAEQIAVTGSEFADALLTPANSIGIWSYDDADTDYHTRLNLYTPATAFNRINTTTTGTTAVTSGVGSVFWSYTLAEEEIIAGTVRIVGRAIDGGTTYRSKAIADFSASRSTGGGAAVTVDNETETGTLAGGAIVTSASGNDVEIELTYTFTGDVDWTITVDLGRVLP